MKTKMIIILSIIVSCLYGESKEEEFKKAYAAFDKEICEFLKENAPTEPTKCPDFEYKIEEDFSLKCFGRYTIYPLVASKPEQPATYLVVVTIENGVEYFQGSIRIYRRTEAGYCVYQTLEDTEIYKAAKAWKGKTDEEKRKSKRAFLFNLLPNAKCFLISPPEKTQDGNIKFKTWFYWFTGLGCHEVEAGIEWKWNDNTLSSDWVHYKKPYEILPIDIYRGGPAVYVAERFQFMDNNVVSVEEIIKDEWLDDMDKEWKKLSEMTLEEIGSFLGNKNRNESYLDMLSKKLYYLTHKSKDWGFIGREISVDSERDGTRNITIKWNGIEPGGTSQEIVYGDIRIRLRREKGKWEIIDVDNLPYWLKVDPVDEPKPIDRKITEKFGYPSRWLTEADKTEFYYVIAKDCVIKIICTDTVIEKVEKVDHTQFKSEVEAYEKKQREKQRENETEMLNKRGAPPTRRTPGASSGYLSRNRTPRTYIVKKGDNLAIISRKFYGSGDYVKVILNANPKIKDPEVLYVGMKLQIPKLGFKEENKW